MEEDGVDSEDGGLSGTAMIEQIAQLTAIISQQAASIQNLSAAVASLSQARFGNGTGSAESNVTRVSARNCVVPPRFSQVNQNTPQTTKKRSAPLPTLDPVQPKRHQMTHPVRKRQAEKVAAGQEEESLPLVRREVRSEPASASDSSPKLLSHCAPLPRRPQPYPIQNAEALAAKRSVMELLEALYQNVSAHDEFSKVPNSALQFLVTCNIVRTRLCFDWLAFRPEELLARLQHLEMELPHRKDLTEGIVQMGPDVIRGRSVKFGRETRRALAIPRCYFSREELAKIDQWFLPEAASSQTKHSSFEMPVLVNGLTIGAWSGQDLTDDFSNQDDTSAGLDQDALEDEPED